MIQCSGAEGQGFECRKITSDAFCTTRQSAKGVLPSTSTVRSSTVGMGSRGADATVLALARSYEEAQGWKADFPEMTDQ